MSSLGSLSQNWPLYWSRSEPDLEHEQVSNLMGIASALISIFATEDDRLR